MHPADQLTAARPQRRAVRGPAARARAPGRRPSATPGRGAEAVLWNCCAAGGDARGRGARRARFRGYNTDLSKVAQFKRDAGDVGSTEVQVAQLTARVSQLTTHLQEHRKDFACRRGLVILLGQRRRLMKYLYMTNRRAPCVGGAPRAP
jgi:ribosomal protein S15